MLAALLTSHCLSCIGLPSTSALSRYSLNAWSSVLLARDGSCSVTPLSSTRNVLHSKSHVDHERCWRIMFACHIQVQHYMWMRNTSRACKDKSTLVFASSAKQTSLQRRPLATYCSFLQCMPDYPGLSGQVELLRGHRLQTPQRMHLCLFDNRCISSQTCCTGPQVDRGLECIQSQSRLWLSRNSQSVASMMR